MPKANQLGLSMTSVCSRRAGNRSNVAGITGHRANLVARARAGTAPRADFEEDAGMKNAPSGVGDTSGADPRDDFGVTL